MMLIGLNDFIRIIKKRFCLISVLCVSLIFLSACSGGSNGNDNTGGGTDRSGGIVNGYHLVKSTSYNEFDQITETRELIYDLERNQIDTTITDIDFDVMRVSTNRIFYDQYGRLARREIPEDAQLREATYTFDSAGRILTYMTGGSLNLSSEFEYDMAGRLSRVVDTALDAVGDPGYSPIVRTYSYNTDGFLESSQFIDTYDDPVMGTLTTTRNTTFFTDTAGQTIRAETTDTDTQNLHTRTYVYDTNGNVVERTISDGGFFVRTVYEYEANQEPIYNHWARLLKYFP
ncbi:MAG: hypothetical protein KTR35_22415 [Gammaproteobacteria bacterium]|nr:hypothetical protein [Gammaproteobacteria bacterium]